MKFRKQNLPETPAAADPAELEAAKYIATAIQQGMRGDMLCNLVNAMDSKQVQRIAALTVHEATDWFKRDAAARQILESLPTFNEFAFQFHKRAQQLYPPGAAEERNKAMNIKP